MTTHQITVEISDEAFAVLQDALETKGFQSESEVIEDAIWELSEADAERSSFSATAAEEAELIAAYDEDVAHPERAIPAEQLDAYLTQYRQRKVELPRAS